MQSKTYTLLNVNNKFEKLQCCAWVTTNGAASCVIQVETDYNGRILSKVKGASQKHANLTDAIYAAQQTRDAALRAGWVTHIPRRQTYNSSHCGVGCMTCRVTPHCGPTCVTCRPPDPRDTHIPAFHNIDSAAVAVVTAGFKALAKIHHPDIGGSTATMAVLTEARKQLRDMLNLVKQ